MRISDWSSDVCSSDLEFTRTTARAIEAVGGAAQGKAIIILNPAEPPMIMRDPVFTLSEGADESTIRASVEAMVAEVQNYVSGYRLKQAFGSASWRESVCQYVYMCVCSVPFKTNH